jgi:hypothetical protein
MRRLRRISCMVVALAALVVLPAAQGGQNPVTGGAFTTVNAGTDGTGTCLNGGGLVNCNSYTAKDAVWLNGGPGANSLSPSSGNFMFAVLKPGGQQNPNDCSSWPLCADGKNLSDDYDCWQNRVFQVTGGEVTAYPSPTGPSKPAGCFPAPVTPFTHWLDSGATPNGRGSPNGAPPMVRLFPFADTPNGGGVYIMAICSLATHQPPNLDPSDCKFDAFKVPTGDTSAPKCQLTATIGGPPKQLQITVQDPQSGLERVDYRIFNGTVAPDSDPTVLNPDGSRSGSADLFVGMASPLVLTATKTDQTASSRVIITATDVAGLTTTCDPVVPAAPQLHLPSALAKMLTTLQRMFR